MARRRTRHRLAALACGAVLTAASAAPAPALNDPEYDSRQWGMQLIGAKAAWDAGILGQGVRIAVLDTGVHFGHFEFSGRLVAGPDYIEPNTQPQDDGHSITTGQPQGHGTHVAGIAAAGIDNGGVVGVAPQATVVAVKVLDRDGTGPVDGILAALKWAADNGIEVINLSLGTIGPDFFEDEATIDTVNYAWNKGSIVVFAAGNDYVFGTEYRNLPALVVSATSRNDTKAYFSSTVANTQWALAAPGGAAAPFGPSEEGIFSPAWQSDGENNTYRYLQGTSQAAPHAAGAAALLRSAGLTPRQTIDRLLGTAKDLGPQGRDDTYGSGRLDVAKAVAGLSPASSPTPTTAASGTSSPPATTAAPAGGGGTATTRRPGSATSAPSGGSPAPVAAPVATPAPADTTAPAVDTTSVPAIEAETDPGPADVSFESAPADSDAGGDDDGAPPWLPIGIAAVALATVGWVAYGRRHLLRPSPPAN